jgi:hypothetical protein
LRAWRDAPRPYRALETISFELDVQEEIVKKFGPCFEACEALLEFARGHRPGDPKHEAALIVAGTIARSDANFKCVVELCRLGYGEEASRLNRVLFEDMVSAHWAVRFPKRATRLLARHDDWARVRIADARDKHNIAYELSSPLPTWWGKRRKRLRALFRGGSWSGRSVPRMVEMVRPLWPDEESAERLQLMHDVFHQGHNVLMHYSARTLGMRVHQADDGAFTFHNGPSERFVGPALGFAFWTYAQTLSLGVQGDDLTELSKLVTKYDFVVPDRYLKLRDPAEPET